MFKIAVNTRLLRPGRLEGIGWFTWESFRRIALAHPEVEFHFFFDENPPSEFIPSDNVIGHRVLPPARRRFLYRWWFDYSIPRKLKSLEVDLFVSPDGFASLRTDVPQLVVMHDLNFEHLPHLLPPKVSEFYQKMFPQYAAKAERIATVSEYSKKDIVSHYAVPSHRIDVVGNGVNEQYRPLSQEERIEVRANFSDEKPYFVYVGSLNPRKNIPRLLRAFEVFKNDTGSDYKLLIVGQPMWKGSEIEEVVKAMLHREDVSFLGRRAPDELALIVGAARAMVFVPLFEGFGIPAIEAFAAGVPLVTSNVTSLPEVAGDAAILVDPKSVSEIAGAMKRIKSDSDLRDDLIERGYARTELYTWDKTAELLWKSIEAAL
ncbi:MAG: glycosyltransferase family 4 protein [Flavobacteriales bacterium]|nr:glycosyltransferase family 4 protein [Flavobacteriales bacterium]